MVHGIESEEPEDKDQEDNVITYRQCNRCTDYVADRDGVARGAEFNARNGATWYICAACDGDRQPDHVTTDQMTALLTVADDGEDDGPGEILQF